MFFNYVLGFQEVDSETENVNHREAVRAVILHDNDLLMVQSNKGDYKFPGGGLHGDENHEEALKRELREETGYMIHSVKDKIGVVTERNWDKYQKDSIFEMISHYYLCEVSDRQTLQQLDDYEAELDLCPIWIGLDKAIRRNEEILEKESNSANPWVYRETFVLKILKDFYSNGEVRG
jgi:8-oxo-dGTP pyrophosphatase MutT (NUDIX family)